MNNKTFKRIISGPKGKPYIGVEVDDKVLRILLLEYEQNYTLSIDKRVIPKLIKFLQESQNDETRFSI